MFFILQRIAVRIIVDRSLRFRHSRPVLNVSVNIRLTEEQAERMDRIAAALLKATGVDVTRSVVLRAVLERGIDAYEREHGLGRGAE